MVGEGILSSDDANGRFFHQVFDQRIPSTQAVGHFERSAFPFPVLGTE